MENIYSVLSNSIVNYLKKQGTLADKSYHILRIHYYNMYGFADSVDILKTLAKGDKIISTLDKTIKHVASTKTSKSSKKKKYERKDITDSTRHSKLGLITFSDWDKLKTEHAKLIHSKLGIASKYCDSYKKITGSIPFFSITSRTNPINKPESSKDLPGEIGNGFLLHGDCDFITKQLDKSNSQTRNKIGIKFTEPTSSIYQIFPNNKSVIRISDCKSLEDFYDRYSSNSSLDWKKIMTKYDGILFENTNCSSSEIPKKTKPNYKKLLMAVLDNTSRNLENIENIKKIKMELDSNKMRNIGYLWRLGKNKFVKII